SGPGPLGYTGPGATDLGGDPGGPGRDAGGGGACFPSRVDRAAGAEHRDRGDPETPSRAPRPDRPRPSGHGQHLARPANAGRASGAAADVAAAGAAVDGLAERADPAGHPAAERAELAG